MIVLLKLVLFSKLKRVLFIYIFKIYREWKQCKIKRVLKRYYNNEDNILQNSRDIYALFKDLDNRLKALEEKITIKDSEIN